MPDVSPKGICRMRSIFSPCCLKRYSMEMIHRAAGGFEQKHDWLIDVFFVQRLMFQR